MYKSIIDIYLEKVCFSYIHRLLKKTYKVPRNLGRRLQEEEALRTGCVWYFSSCFSHYTTHWQKLCKIMKTHICAIQISVIIHGEYQILISSRKFRKNIIYVVFWIFYHFKCPEDARNGNETLPKIRTSKNFIEYYFEET